MTNAPVQESDNSFQPVIRRAQFDQLTIYEISESELDILEKGSPGSLYLNFAIFLLSGAISFIVSLLTVEITSLVTLVVFILFAIVGCLGGLFLLLLWGKGRSSVSLCVRKIRSRLPPAEGIQEQ